MFELFNPTFKPLWQQGEILTIIRADKTETVQILQVMSLPSIQYDGGTLTSASSLALAPTAIQLGSNELGQFRFVLRDFFEVEMKHPQGTVQYWRSRANNYRVQPWLLDKDTPSELKLWMWAASEFFVWSDRTPSFDAYKFGSATSVELYFTFMGIKYVTKTLEEDQVLELAVPPETLWVDGLAQAGAGKGAA